MGSVWRVAGEACLVLSALFIAGCRSHEPSRLDAADNDTTGFTDECSIGGTVFVRGAQDPANACQTCDPSVSAAAWSGAQDGTVCATGLCRSGSCTPAPFYWFPEYRSYYDRTFVAPADIRAGDTIGMAFPYNNSSTLVDASPGGGFLRDDGGDLRVIYDDGTRMTEIPRSLVNFPGPTATIQFNASAAHPAGSTVGTYKLLLGYANAGAPLTISASTIRTVTPTDTPKVNAATPASQALADARSGTITDAQGLYGADQATGAEYGFRWTSNVTDKIAHVDIPLQQFGSPYLQAYDAHLLVYADDGGVPGALLGRAVASTFPVEKETGAWRAVPFQFDRTFLNVSSGSTYHFIVRMFGAGSATMNIKLGLVSVGTGGNLVGRSRASGAWGPWITDTSRSVPFSIFAGTPPTAPTVALTTVRSGESILLPSQSWENADPTKTIVYISQAWQEGGQWRAFFHSYSTWTDQNAGQEKVGTATSSDGVTWTQNPNNPILDVIDLPTTDSTKNMWMYDATPGALRAYFSSRYSDGRAVHRHLRHAHNDIAWDAAWTDDGEVTYPWPPFGDILTAEVHTFATQPYLYLSGKLNDADAWQLVRQFRAKPDSNLTMAELEETRVDWSDNDADGGFFTGEITVVEHNGIYYGLLTREVPTTGAYYFTAYSTKSLDGVHFSTPVLIPDFSPSGSDFERRGCSYPVSTPDGNTLFFFSVEDYELGSSNTIYAVPSRRDIVWQ